jgi:hypothetical protein
MKNHKGEIATLLTLGLIIVGGLITLGTSLFVSNQKSNLASNSRAALYCPTGSHCIPASSSCSTIGQIENVNGDCLSGGKEGVCCYNSTTTPPPSPTPTGKAGSGNAWPRDPLQGYDPILCKTSGLEFACCVQNKNSSQCDGKSKYTWYGCTGQPCGNTKIKQSNGPGNLVKCEYGAGPALAIACEVVSTPTPAVGVINCLIRNSQYSYRADEYSCKTSCTGSFKQVSGVSCGNSNQVCCKKSKNILTTVPTLASIGGRNEENSSSINPTEAINAGSLQAINTPTPTSLPTLTLIATAQCQNQECSSPNKGIFYSYKCTGALQTIGGITQCPSSTNIFYEGKGCGIHDQISKKTIADIDIEKDYCNANWHNNSKRNVKIHYEFSLSKPVDIDPENPVVTFYVFNPFFRLKVDQAIPDTSINKFPLKGDTNVTTGSNKICITLSYHTRVLPLLSWKMLTQCGEVEDQTVSISADVFNAK